MRCSGATPSSTGPRRMLSMQATPASRSWPNCRFPAPHCPSPRRSGRGSRRLRAGLLKVRRWRFRHGRLGRDIGRRRWRRRIANVPFALGRGEAIVVDGGPMSPSSASKNPAFAGVGGGVVVGADVVPPSPPAAARKAVADEVVVDAEVVPPAPPPLPKPPAPVSAPLRPPAPPPPPRNPAVAGAMSPRSKSVGGGLPTKVTTSS